MTATLERLKRLVVVLVKTSKYDRDGYLIQFARAVLPCNSLAAMWSLTKAAFTFPAFQDIYCEVVAFDETTRQGRVDPRAIMEQYAAPDAKVVVGFVGVQTNMFPRACDLAREFKRLGATIIIGGFHVSGSITMLLDGNVRKKNGELIPCSYIMPPELQALMDEGIILFHGEAEGIWPKVLSDIFAGNHALLYRGGKPAIDAAPLPQFPVQYFRGFMYRCFTVDTCRGCPFECSFCTSIRVQGNIMRFREPKAIIAYVRSLCIQGKAPPFFFFTDDNFARNPHWKEILEGLIALREEEGLEFVFMIEADLAAWKLPQFVKLLGRAGCTRTFMGVESVRQETLNRTQKKQNQVSSYSEICAAYHSVGIAVHGTYIVGFPNDTPQTVAEDVRTLNALGFDQVSLFMLTPLPGSEDHARLHMNGTPMDADFNRYDTFQPATDHPRMSRDEWQAAYEAAWRQFYTPDHMIASLRRVGKRGYWGLFKNFIWYRWSALHENVHPMMGGFYRYRRYEDRRKEGPPISVEAHLVGEILRHLRYIPALTQEFRLFREVYFATWDILGIVPAVPRFKSIRFLAALLQGNA
ncbi:MAG: radical SAM protein [Candidatus Liptonbacteria bacterium]|nr:radical SAM protein [Candidatus Liptonbacteria bacterium]